MIARIARRIARKIAKPVALWLVNRQMAVAEHRAEHFCLMRVTSIPMEVAERKRQVVLTAKRNRIQNW